MNKTLSCQPVAFEKLSILHYSKNVSYNHSDILLLWDGTLHLRDFLNKKFLELACEFALPCMHAG